MLPLPNDPTDSIRLADWLELGALLAKDRNSSFGDLERALRRAALQEIQADEEIERKIAEVADELNRRSIAAASGYPFNFEGSVVSIRKGSRQATPYLFCLCLSYFGDRRQAGLQIAPRRLFEEISSTAAGNYVSGRAVRFGWPRKTISNDFKKAVTSLCSRDYIGEGLQFREQPTFSAKDSRLDVVAWRNSPDELPGKLLLFGACSSGNDWRDKLYELNPVSFCNKWMAEQPISFVKAFFVPHRLELQRWGHYGLDAGIIFDRCRIAFWSVNGTNKADYSEYLQWVRSALKAARL
jgi:hypothetical protein